MTPFNFSTYLKLVKDRFVNNSGQEKAAILLFKSVTDQLGFDLIFDKSKISNLANNKTEVDGTIKKALQQQQRVVTETLKYFDDEVFGDLQPDMVSDTCESIIRALKADKTVPKDDIGRFEQLYNSGNVCEFLGRTFIYAVLRQNKAPFDKIEDNSNSENPTTTNNVFQNNGSNQGIQVAHADKINIHVNNLTDIGQINNLQQEKVALNFPYNEYYNLIVGWNQGADFQFREGSKTIGSFIFPKSRILNGWCNDEVRILSSLGKEDRNVLTGLSCIFAKDQGPVGDTPGDLAYIGEIHKITVRGNDVKVVFEIHSSFEQSNLYKYKFEFDIGDYELYNTHWAVKEVDIETEYNRANIETTSIED